MDKKYSPENVTEALKPYERYKDAEPANDSITSRLLDANADTIFFVYKKYPLYEINLFPAHYYVVIDGKIFHPGGATSPIFLKSDERENVITSIEEKCKFCTYQALNTLFESDKHYNIFTKNCQIILGSYINTIILATSLVCIALYVVIGYTSFVFIGIVMIAFSIIYDKLLQTQGFQFESCKHIKSVAFIK